MPSSDKKPDINILKREKSLKNALAKNKQTSNFLDSLTKEVMDLGRENLTSASVIGVFIVYIQLLEQRIKDLLSTIYLRKSHTSIGNTNVIRKHNFSGLALKKLSLELKNVEFYNSKTKENYLSDFVFDLDKFINKRNKYIHKVLDGEMILKKKKFDKELLLAQGDLTELLNQINNLNKRVNKLFKLDGSFENFINHMVDDEK